MTDALSLIGLFFSAFLAATIVPTQSEAVLAALLVNSGVNWSLLIFIATFGNVLGSCTSWWLGLQLERFKHAKWFPVSNAMLTKGQGWFQRWGIWSLLLSWVPVIGDALCVAAGVLRVKLLPFAVLVTIGKLARYLVVAGVVARVF